MFGNYGGLLIVSILGRIALSSGQVCSNPSSIPPMGGDVPSQALGDWFAYRHGGVVVNHRFQTKSFGPTIEPNSNTTTVNAINMYMQSAWLQNGKCQNEFWIGFYNTEGLQSGKETFPSDNYTTIKFRDYQILYHDYQKLMVGYACPRPNTDGTCTGAVAWVWSRARPDKLSAGEIASFDSIINNAYKNTCFSTQNMPIQTFDDNQQTCPMLEQPPACIASLIQGTELLSPISGQAPVVAQQAQTGNTTTSTGYGSPTPVSSTPASTCKWPLNINASQNVKRNPSQVAGLWYVYRTQYEGINEPINNGMRYFWTMVNDGILAASNMSGTFAWAEYAVYTPNGTECQHYYWTGLLADTAGMGNVGVRFFTNGTVDGQVPNSPMTIYQDDKYQFLYGCYFPNLATGMCDAAYAIFGARTNPTDWSASEKDNVDNNIITPLFKEFGCSASDMQVILQPKDKPECPFKGSTPCLDLYIAGYKEQAPQVSVTTSTPKPSSPPAYYY